MVDAGYVVETSPDGCSRDNNSADDDNLFHCSRRKDRYSFPTFFSTPGGHSGFMPPGYQLKSVVSLIRHGERSSLEEATSAVDKPDYDLDFGEDIQLFRGYAKFWKQYRAMLPSVPFELSDIRLGFVSGILTPRGIVQSVQLGKNLKKTYNSWFDTKKKDAMIFHVESTSFARTYHSALAFLYGFLGQDAIGVSVFVNRASTRFCSHSWCKCKNGLARFRNVLNELYSKYYNEFLDSKISSIIEDGNRILLNGGSSTSLSRLIDLLLPYACRPTADRFPCSPDADRCFGVRDFRILNDFGDKIVRRVSISKEGRLKGLIEAMAVFQKWRENILRATENDASGSFELYSDHETTLIAVLIGLGVFDGVIPPMASSVRMEVLKHMTSGKSYMRVFYNGVDITEKTIFCRNMIHSELCDVNKFLEFLNQYVDGGGKVTSVFRSDSSDPGSLSSDDVGKVFSNETPVDDDDSTEGAAAACIPSSPAAELDLSPSSSSSDGSSHCDLSQPNIRWCCWCS
uniref:2-phosphoxylose phosphatase 1 n=1 Tax=Romanomermis culicivorax TaxID=13658 RepID=A0A915IBQ6_ROMCU